VSRIGSTSSEDHFGDMRPMASAPVVGCAWPAPGTPHTPGRLQGELSGSLCGAGTPRKRPEARLLPPEELEAKLRERGVLRPLHSAGSPRNGAKRHGRRHVSLV